ncbi:MULTISPECIES: YusW family protein [unclassified Psychrobacillus]|uniref:YusW family protein n=1 Tax=unclassified Psychrobacillus TaxID=2636677 RepID=UPI00146AD818|nr:MULTISPECIES: YusW family protein [unclassified Psychrobacillus]
MMINKKRALIITSILSTTFLLGACNDNNDENDENVLKSDVVEPNPVDDSAQVVTNPETDYGFQEFTLIIDTPDNEDAVIVEYKLDSSSAVYKNMHTAVNAEGEGAAETLDPIFKDLNLTKEMNTEDVVEEVSKAFEVEDFTAFNLDIQYDDGETKNYAVN